MEDVTLDYETRSACSLTLKGAIEYAKHPSTSIFCLAYKIGAGETKLWIPERAPMPEDLWQAFQHSVLVAHNASFERAITRWCLPRYSLLTKEQKDFLIAIASSRWRCTAAKAAACSLPRNLEEASEILELAVKKDMKGNRLLKKYSKPRKPSRKNPSLWWTNRKDLRAIYRYCMIDVEAEYLLDQELPDLMPYEQKVWELDQIVNDRGVLIDIPTVKLILRMVHEEMHYITKCVRELSGNEILSVSQTAKVLAWVNARGAKMKNLQSATIRDKLLETQKLDPQVRKMLEYRQSGSKTSTAKYVSMIEAVGDDYRARELLLYCGAFVTGRWSGKRVQPQNFPRPTIKDFDSNEAIEIIQKQGIEGLRKRYGKTKVMDALVSSIRGMIIASPGKELFCADFSSIELCLAFWIAGHSEGVNAIVNGRKMYEEMAAAAFDMDLEWLLTEKGKKSIERFVGKESVLGCGYGMGWKKFLKNCHQKGVPQVTEEMAKKAVFTYRRVHSPIPNAWESLERCAIKAIQKPGKKFKICRVTVYTHDKFLVIRLPSGRKLRYFKPRISYKQLSGGRMVPQIHHWGYVAHQWVETVTWGGVLFNNVVQGVSRDLIANAMLNIENAGYDFLLSIHDEPLAERKKNEGSLDEYIRLMAKDIPDWAKGAPISAEGWVGQRYHK